MVNMGHHRVSLGAFRFERVMTKMIAISSDLQQLIRDLSFDDELLKKLYSALAESEGRFGLWARPPDFGAVVRHRRVRPALYDKSGAKIAAAHISEEAPLPVKTGALVGGWNWKVRKLNAKVETRRKYAPWARKVGEPVGSGLAKVEEWLENDWSSVADEIATIVEEYFR